ncbi:MAG: Gfo/Idh/MocA family oxidoreductase [Planctomycetota bacterium]
MSLQTRRRFLSHSAVAGVSAMGLRNTVAADMHSKIRIGQIGTRHAHASGKIEAMRKLSDLFEVVGVVEPDSERRKQLARSEAYRDLPWMTTEQLLNAEGLAAVAVETSVDELVPTALLAVRAGKHVHLDKPAGTSMSEYRRLRREADERGLTIQMGYMLRYNPAFKRLFQIIDDGWLGPLTELNAMMGKKASASMRRELAQFAGGGMFELACHLIDAMVTILGKPTEITAFNRRTKPDQDSFADSQIAIFEYPHLVATVRCNHLDPFGFARREFTVVGEQGYYQISPLEPPRVELALDRARGELLKGIQPLEFPKMTGRYDEEFRDFAGVIRGDYPQAWDSEHDLTVHEAILRGSGMPVR